MHEQKYSLASDCYHRGQIDTAIDLLKELLAYDPNSSDYHGLLAGCLIEKKRLYAAEFELSIALKLDPQNAFLFVLQARVCLLRNKNKESIDFCDEALKLEPEYLNAFLLKSDIYLIYNQFEEAKNCIDNASKFHPDSVTVAQYYGDYFLTKSSLKKAEFYATEALANDPQDEASNVLMGKVRLRQGNLEEAEYHAKFVIRQNPDSNAALKLFCDIKMRKNIFLGMWWKFNAKMTSLSNIKSAIILIAGYLIFMLASQVFKDLGYPKVSILTSYAWIGLVIYSWLGIPLYYKQLKKELAQFSFNSDF